MKLLKLKAPPLGSGFIAGVLLALLLGWPVAIAVEKPDFLDPEYISLSLQGNLSDMENILTAREQTPNTIELLERFRARFIERSDGLDLENEDPLVQDVGGLVQEYWRDALLNPGQRGLYEKTLAEGVLALLQNSEYASPDINPGTLMSHLSKALEDKGYYSTLGRTAPLLEFMIWKKVDQNTTSVELTDGFQEVEVNYLGDFVSLGWASFATFGGPSAGGWANLEGLFVVAEKWDLESESFKVSFLKHESRHFADYKLYPKLKGSDLEYRAKLTEISFADESMYDLLTKFTNHAARVENAPHPLANWHVITDLSQELLNREWPDDPNAWSQIPIGELQAAARKLLTEHGRQLNEAGARKTKGIITP